MEEAIPSFDPGLLTVETITFETLGFDLHGPWVRLRFLSEGHAIVEVAGFLDHAQVAGAAIALLWTGHGHLRVGTGEEGPVDLDLSRVEDTVAFLVRPPPNASADHHQGASPSATWSSVVAPVAGWRVRAPLRAFLAAAREHVAHYGETAEVRRLLRGMDAAASEALGG